MAADIKELVHPLVVRVTHWINVVAVLLMVASGWRIYNADPIFDFSFPDELTLGGWLAGALQWHFAAMWLLVLNGLVYVCYGILSGHFRRKLLPISPLAVLRDVRDALRGRLAHDDLSVYNAAQRAAYLALIVALVVMVLSGLAIWKPVQLYWLAMPDGRLRRRPPAALLRHGGGGADRGRARDHGDPRAAHLSHDVHGPHSEGVMSNKMGGSFLAQRTPQVANLERRLFLKRGLSVGALALLAGCELTDAESVQKVLWAMSGWNDRVQDWLFDPSRLAPEFPESRITRPFPFNGYYSESEVRVIDGTDYKLELGGMIRDTKPWRLPELYALPQVSQVTRHICVEGWSAIGKWSGVRFSDFLQRVGADTTAKYVGFQCADDYSTSIDMATALHPQTLLALRFADEILPPKYGFPMKLRMPTKLGFKNPKHIAAIFVTNEYPGGYWEDKGYNWFSGS